MSLDFSAPVRSFNHATSALNLRTARAPSREEIQRGEELRSARISFRDNNTFAHSVRVIPLRPGCGSMRPMSATQPLVVTERPGFYRPEEVSSLSATLPTSFSLRTGPYQSQGRGCVSATEARAGTCTPDFEEEDLNLLDKESALRRLSVLIEQQRQRISQNERELGEAALRSRPGTGVSFSQPPEDPPLDESLERFRGTQRAVEGYRRSRMAASTLPQGRLSRGRPASAQGRVRGGSRASFSVEPGSVSTYLSATETRPCSVQGVSNYQKSRLSPQYSWLVDPAFGGRNPLPYPFENGLCVGRRGRATPYGSGDYCQDKKRLYGWHFDC